MSSYNTLAAVGMCPFCGERSSLDIDFRFGFKDQTVYQLGDALVWDGRGPRTPPKRPAEGNFEGEGYTECPVCGKPFWMRILVRGDVLEEAQVDRDRGDSKATPN